MHHRLFISICIYIGGSYFLSCTKTHFSLYLAFSSEGRASFRSLPIGVCPDIMSLPRRHWSPSHVCTIATTGKRSLFLLCRVLSLLPFANYFSVFLAKTLYTPWSWTHANILSTLVKPFLFPFTFIFFGKDFLRREEEREWKPRFSFQSREADACWLCIGFFREISDFR